MLPIELQVELFCECLESVWLLPVSQAGWLFKDLD